jgi:excisionase family DNA binding protein
MGKATNGNRPVPLLLAQAEKIIAAYLQELLDRHAAGDKTVTAEVVDVYAKLRAGVPPEKTAWLTTGQMSERLQVSRKTVRELGRTGKLEAYRLGPRGGRAIRFKEPV